MTALGVDRHYTIGTRHAHHGLGELMTSQRGDRSRIQLVSVASEIGGQAWRGDGMRRISATAAGACLLLASSAVQASMCNATHISMGPGPRPLSAASRQNTSGINRTCSVKANVIGSMCIWGAHRPVNFILRRNGALVSSSVVPTTSGISAFYTVNLPLIGFLTYTVTAWVLNNPGNQATITSQPYICP
jgi:hypothetical protein